MVLPIRRGSAVAVLALLAASRAEARPDVIHDKSPLEMLRANLARGATIDPGNFIVTSRSADDRPALELAAKALGCEVVRQLGHRPLFTVRCKLRSVEDLVAEWCAVDAVRWIDASYVETLEAAPDDLITEQWYHHNTGQRIDNVVGRPGADMHSLDAWDITTGTHAQVIAIVDVGIYPHHVDLEDRIWHNPREICDNGIDDDDNGYVDDCIGWDFGANDNDPDPSTLPDKKPDGSDCLNWHATMIAGLAAAHGNNGVGITGIDWDVSLMDLKRHSDTSCNPVTNSAVEAITYAIDNGANVISMSFNSSSYSASFEHVLQEAEAKGMISVSSGGNGGTDDEQETRYPNEYAIHNKLVSVSTDNRDRLWSGSNWGATKVDLASPGNALVSTSIGSPTEYAMGSGSSFTAGMCAGAVTLLWSAYPSATAAEVVQAIKEGVVHLDTLDCTKSRKCVATGGRLDLFGALRRASELLPADLAFDAPVLTDMGNGNDMVEAGEHVVVSARVHNQGRGAAFGVRAAVSVDVPGLTVVTASTSLGKIDPGMPNDPSAEVPAIELAVSSTCAASFTAHATLTLTDRFDHTWTSDPFEVAVHCEGEMPDGGVTPDGGAEVDGGGTPGLASQDSGCTCIARTGGASSLGLVALLGLALLRIKAPRRRR